MTTTTHLGKKIERIREIRGMKQDTLAAMLGVSQQAVSKMEQSEKIEDEKLEVVAKALGITPEAIKNFNEEAAFSIIASTFNITDNGVLNGPYNFNCTFNPIEKIVHLYDEKIGLYERMLKEKEEIIKQLQSKEK